MCLCLKIKSIVSTETMKMLLVLVWTLASMPIWSGNAAKLRDHLLNIDTSLTKGAKGSLLAINGGGSLPGYIHDVLLSIDERLRNLDSQHGSPHKLGKIEFTLEQMGRRLENIEAKLSRMETKFEIRLEKVEDVVNEKDRKVEFSNVQMGRQLDSLHDKFNNKFAILDTKIEMRFERVNQRIEALEREVQVYGDDILEKLAKSEERQSTVETRCNPATLETTIQRVIREENHNLNVVNSLTNWMEDNLVNVTGKTPADSEIGNFRVETAESTSVLKNQSAMILGSLEYLKENCLEFNYSSSDSRLRTILNDYDFASYNSQTKEKMENMTATLQRSLRLNEGRFKKLDNDVESYSRKVVNSIHELRQSSDQLSGLMRDIFQDGNLTRQIIQLGFDELHEQIKLLSTMKPEVAGVSESLDRRLYDLGTKVDNKFSILLTAQNTFIDSCSRIQEEETQVYEALGKVVREVRTRSRVDMDKIAQNLRNHSHFLTQNLETILMAILMSSNETADRIVDMLASGKIEVPAASSSNCDCAQSAQESNDIRQNLDNLRSQSPDNEDEITSRDLVARSGSKMTGDFQSDQPFPFSRSYSENPVPKSIEKSPTLDYDPDYQMQEAEYFDT